MTVIAGHRFVFAHQGKARFAMIKLLFLKTIKIMTRTAGLRLVLAIVHIGMTFITIRRLAKPSVFSPGMTLVAFYLAVLTQ
jgi:hypothetical protein